MIDLDLETGEPTVLYVIPTVPSLRRIASVWRGPHWYEPVVRIGEDLLVRDERRLRLFVKGEPKPVDPAPRLTGGPWPDVRGAVPWKTGALLLGPTTLSRVSRTE